MPTLHHPDTGEKKRVWLPLKKKLEFFERGGFVPWQPEHQWYTDTCPAKKGEFDTVKDTPQMQFFKSSARFTMLIAGTRWGKSLAASWEVASEVDMLPRIIKRPVNWWIVCPILDLGMLEYTYIIEALSYAGVDVKTREKPYPTITHPNGSTVQVRTARTGAEISLMGREVDGAIISEGALLSNLRFVWERRLRRALGSREGRLIIPTTPFGYGTLKAMYNHGDMRHADGILPEWADWQSLGPYRNIDGGGMDMIEFEKVKKELSEESFQEQYLGMFVPRTGRVYKEFLRGTHTYNDEQEQKLMQFAEYSSNQILIGCDWGSRNETAIIFCAKMGERHYIFDEIYEKELTVPQIAELFKLKLEKWNITSYTAYADHDIHLQQELMRLGIYTQNARKADKVKSIMHMQQLLHPVELPGKPNQKLPLLLVHKRCTNLIDEFEEYHYPESSKEGGYESEIPEKGHDHAADATRYLVYSPRRDLWSPKQRERVK